MIGLNKMVDGVCNRQNEPLETRDLSKQRLYNRLSEAWLLPPAESKGVCRAWLLKVWNGSVYRVGLKDLKTFEVAITPAMMKRNGLTNLLHLMLRINGLLNSRGEKVLGFGDFTVPDERWLCRVARFIDQANILEFFQYPVVPIEKLTREMAPSEQVHFCRMFAHENLLQIPGHMANQNVYSAVINVSEWHRKHISKRIEAEECGMRHNQVLAEEKKAEASLRDHLMKAATAVYCVENVEFKPEKLINGGNDLKQEERTRLQTIAEMYILLIQGYNTSIAPTLSLT